MLVIDDILMEYLFQSISTVMRDPRGRDILPEKNKPGMERRRSGILQRTAFGTRQCLLFSDHTPLCLARPLPACTCQEAQFMTKAELRDSGSWCKFSPRTHLPLSRLYAGCSPRPPRAWPMFTNGSNTPLRASCQPAFHASWPGPGFPFTAPLFSWTAL